MANSVARHIGRFAWPAIAIACVGVAAINLRSARMLKAASAASSSSHDSVVQALLASKHTAYRQLGRALIWPALDQVSSKGVPRLSNPLKQHRPVLILVLSDQSCSVCEEDETLIANKLSKAAGPTRVIAVVSAAQRRYVAAYARVNRVTFPVYFDRDRKFARANSVHVQPLTLLVNAMGEIVAANHPLPGRPEFAAPFHDAAARILATPENHHIE